MTKKEPAPRVEVMCAYDEMVPLHKLVPNPRNPNTHPDEQIRLLAKIIDYQGWRLPIVVSNRSGFIVKGHARLQAAEALGFEEAPVDYQDYDSEAQEWADLLADNRIAELAEMDKPTLKDLLGDLDTGDIDMEVTGYADRVLEDMMTAVAPRPDVGLLADEFEGPERGKAKEDQNWFYVEYYGKDDEFAKVKQNLTALGVMLTDHQIDGDKFAALIEGCSSEV